GSHSRNRSASKEVLPATPHLPRSLLLALQTTLPDRTARGSAAFPTGSHWWPSAPFPAPRAAAAALCGLGSAPPDPAAPATPAAAPAAARPPSERPANGARPGPIRDRWDRRRAPGSGCGRPPPPGAVTPRGAPSG